MSTPRLGLKMGVSPKLRNSRPFHMGLGRKTAKKIKSSPDGINQTQQASYLV